MTHDEAFDRASKSAALTAQLLAANIEKATERATHVVLMVLLDAGDAQQDCCMASTLTPAQVVDLMRSYIAKYEHANPPTKH